ncbi:protein arginine N-methyltransferase [Prochlorococcus marinus]|uniref:protein arginine N-methyltransferase n=1 Tax=Prochlorococcus marinus TaxID=1219 RepID=UPI001F15977D|nr:CmcI family methyltransferase [Prochlorococcus marinus]
MLEIGENNAAIKAFQTSIKLDETFIAAWGNIGAALISESRHQEALPATQKVLELDPDNPTAHMNLGSIYKELGNLDQALASILKSLELKPDDSDAHMNLGGIYKKLGELDQALASTLQSLELKPDNPTALMNLGGIYKDLGKLDQALASTLKSLELKPDNADAHMLIGSIYKDLGNLDQAIASFTQHFELTSAHVETKAIISNVIDSHVRKIISQDNIPTFFDKAVDRALRGIGASQCDELKIYESLVDSKKDRFITLAKRKAKTQGQRQLDGMPISVSQGTHSLIKWKDYEIFKTANDLAIYSMIINEVRPEIIIEIGSGVGGSAIWMSDICNALGLETHIYSYDIKKPDIVNKNVTFIEFDLCKIGNSACLPLANSFMGKSKIVIEDAHVNVLNVMNELNTFLYKGDYLVIEDSSGKQRQIEEFVLIQGEKYRVDQFFLDFFGINMSCSIDSIFRVF